jgi:hypothetical protein
MMRSMLEKSCACTSSRRAIRWSMVGTSTVWFTRWRAMRPTARAASKCCISTTTFSWSSIGVQNMNPLLWYSGDVTRYTRPRAPAVTALLAATAVVARAGSSTWMPGLAPTMIFGVPVEPEVAISRVVGGIA